MSEFNLESLTPEEKKMLLDALSAKHDDQAQDHAEDAQQDASMMKPVINMIEAMNKRIDYIQSVLEDQLLNPISDLYNQQEREYGVKGLQEKYGDRFDPYKDFYSTLNDGGDLYQKLYDELSDKKKSSPEWNDEAETSTVDSIHNTFKELMDKIRSIPTAEAGGDPEEASVEVTEVKAEPVDQDKSDMDALAQKVRSMRNKSSNMKM